MKQGCSLPFPVPYSSYSSQLAIKKKSSLACTLPSPEMHGWAEGTDEEEVESYKCAHRSGRERVNNSQKAAVIRLKDEHKFMWGEHSGRINCREGVSRGGCENFCKMKRLYLQSLQKLWSWPPSLSHTHIQWDKQGEFKKNQERNQNHNIKLLLKADHNILDLKASKC